MKLVRLELENFRQHLSTAIDFLDGVTGIIGANGAGKTTILEGIAWALYGSPAIRGNNDSVRSKAAAGGAKATVKLAFELGGANYCVTRALDASKTGHAVLEVDGRPLRTGTKEVNAAIAHLLGMDYQAFFTSFFTGQKQMEFMATLEGRARAAAIGRMLGYDRLTKAREQANADRLGLAREIEGLEKGLADPEELKQRKKEAQSGLARCKKLLEDAEARRRESEHLSEKLKPLKEASDQKCKRREELSRRLEIDRADVARMETRSAQLSAELGGLKSKREEFDLLRRRLSGFKDQADELRKLNELSQFEGERQRIAGQRAALETDLKQLRARERSLEPARDAHIKASAALDAAEQSFRDLDKKVQDCREERLARQHSLDAQIAQLETQAKQIAGKREQIAQAGAEGKCPTCERPLADELPTVLANFDSQSLQILTELQSLVAERDKFHENQSELVELSESRDSIARHIETLRNEKADQDRRLAELENTLRDVQAKSALLAGLDAELGKLPSGFDEQRFRELQRLKESLQPDRERAAALNGELERQPRIESEHAELLAQLDSKKLQIGASEAALAEIGFSEDDHKRLSEQFEAAVAALNEALVSVERQRGEANTAAAILAQIEREEDAYKAKVEGLSAKRSQRLHLQTLSEAFDRLRAELNDRIRPELESIASELLSEMTDGRYCTLEISDSYSAMIRDDGELKPVISGGEDDIVNLALRLAVSQMIADRAGQSFSLLVLDEVFGSLDDVRRDNVVALLQNLKNRFEQIIIITHVEAIHDAVDNCLWVSFDEKTKTSRLIDRSVELDQTAGILP